jgi:hypothetical protein
MGSSNGGLQALPPNLYQPLHPMTHTLYALNSRVGLPATRMSPQRLRRLFVRDSLDT